jgi:hypothetical protein
MASKKLAKLLKSTEKYYKGKKVPKKYQKKYGKTYNKKEAESIAYAIAKRQGWKVNKRKAKNKK